MEPKNVEIDYKNLCEKAFIENEQMAEKIVMQEELIDKQKVEIKNQQDIIQGLERRVESLHEDYERLSFDNTILKAQMDVVRMIFGGGNRG